MLSNEIWKPIKNFEGLYEISNLGRVKALDREKNCNKGNGINHFVDYVCDDLDYCFTHIINWSNLNDEVEIIEEDKKIEKLDLNTYATIGTEVDKDLIIKINEIIGVLNEK